MQNYPPADGPWDLEPIIHRLEADEIKYYPYILKSADNSSEMTTQQDHLAMKVILDRMQSLIDELEDHLEQLRPFYEPLRSFDDLMSPLDDFVPQGMTYFAFYPARLVYSSAHTFARKACQKLTNWVNHTNTQGADERYKQQQLLLQKFKGFIARQRSLLTTLEEEMTPEEKHSPKVKLKID